jgi:hypothetical protein
MKLNETVDLMLSEDYKDRFKGEYEQLTIRINGLKAMLTKWENFELEFISTCPYELLESQLMAMKLYQKFLIDRAEIEGIEL